MKQKMNMPFCCPMMCPMMNPMMEMNPMMQMNPMMEMNPTMEKMNPCDNYMYKDNKPEIEIKIKAVDISEIKD